MSGQEDDIERQERQPLVAPESQVIGQQDEPSGVDNFAATGLSLLSGHYGSGGKRQTKKTDFADKEQRQFDEKVEKVMRKCGGDSYCNNIVDSRQFEDYPAMTLLVARVIRAVLGVFIVVCVIALVTGYFLEGKITTLEEVDQQESLPAPHIALCPLPWGGKFVEPVKPGKLEVVQIPAGGEPPVMKKPLAMECTGDGRLQGCQCFDFDTTLAPRGERGNLPFLDYLRFEFTATEASAANNQFAFGFFRGGLTPQQWTYAKMGHLTEGDVRFEEVAKGKTGFTEGTTTPRFGFKLTGSAERTDGVTVLQFGYDKYLAYVVSSFGNKYSVFAVMTIMITFCAAINNFGLFEIMFPEKVDDEAPAQLTPSIACASICGMCCIFCRPKDKSLMSPKTSVSGSRSRSAAKRSRSGRVLEVISEDEGASQGSGPGNV